MVDALHEVHRVLAEGGLLIDARPSSRLLAEVEHTEAGRRRVVGTVQTTRPTRADDRSSDRAVARVKGEGLFRSRRSGVFIHRLSFGDVRALREYLDDHLRLVRRVRWSVDASTRRRWRDDPLILTRPVQFELLDRI